MSKHVRQVFGLLITIFCLLGCVGCESDSNAEYARIMNDPTLTTQQKMMKLDNVNYDTNEPMEVASFSIAGGVGGLLVLLLLIKKKMDQGALAAAMQSGGARASAKGAANPAPRGKSAQPAAAVAQRPAATLMQRSYAAPVATPSSAVAGPAVGAALDDLPNQPPVRVNRIPENQQDVDEIPEDEQGVSFFSSRPLPRWALEELVIVIEGHERLVMATPQECQSYRDGDSPKVRGFSANGKTFPWYEFRNYDPYRHYWIARHRDWNIFRGGVTATLVKVDNLNPDLPGYYDVDEDEACAPDAPAAASTTQPPAASQPAPSHASASEPIAASPPIADPPRIPAPEPPGEFVMTSPAEPAGSDEPAVLPGGEFRFAPPVDAFASAPEMVTASAPSEAVFAADPAAAAGRGLEEPDPLLASEAGLEQWGQSGEPASTTDAARPAAKAARRPGRKKSLLAHSSNLIGLVDQGELRTILSARGTPSGDPPASGGEPQASVPANSGPNPPANQSAENQAHHDPEDLVIDY